MKRLIFIIGLVAVVGCASAPKVAYRTVGSSSITVEVAVAGYDALAKAGKTTIAQNIKVADAYAKYQNAMATVCDAGAIYSASTGTNAPAASLALQQAVSNGSQSLTDLITLVQSFGVKL